MAKTGPKIGSTEPEQVAMSLPAAAGNECVGPSGDVSLSPADASPTKPYEARIVEVFERINEHNPSPGSGHSWTTQGKLLGFEVRDSFGQTTRHKTFEKAEQEQASREEFHKRHPFEIPHSDHEKEKAKKLGLI